MGACHVRQARYLSLYLSLLLLLWLPPQAASAQPGAAVPVVAAPVSVDSIAETLNLSGTVTAYQAAELSVSVQGLVTVLNVDAGDGVEAGQVLLELDADLAGYQYQAAAAAVTQAERALADARRRLAEARRLAPQQSIAETAVRDLEAEVEVDKAALDQASATAGYRKGILERHRLTAPFSGVITRRLTELGEWVTPGQAVLGLVATDKLRLDFQAPEDHLQDIRVGQPVRFSLGTGEQLDHRGTVSAIVPVTDPTARTFLLRVSPDEEIQGMQPGNAVRAEMSLRTGTEGLSVPRDAILRHADGRIVVWVVEQTGEGASVREQRIETGHSFDGRVEVLSGLSAGQQVVVRGNERLRPNQAVELR
jgi:RND family efflux transporter MFP subunit